MHPIAALQTEYSLWTRDVEAEILPACRELGIGFMPYARSAAGFLTGDDQAPRRLRKTTGGATTRASTRRTSSAISGCSSRCDELAAAQGAARPRRSRSPGCSRRATDIVPIPGTKRRRYLEENVAAPDVRLDAADLARLDQAFPPGITAGERYPAGQMKRVGL